MSALSAHQHQTEDLTSPPSSLHLANSLNSNPSNAINNNNNYLPSSNNPISNANTNSSNTNNTSGAATNAHAVSKSEGNGGPPSPASSDESTNIVNGLGTVAVVSQT